jgi:hypothetical protein
MKHNRYFGLLLACVTLTAVTWAQSTDIQSQRYPDVLAVKVTPRGANRFDFDVTLSSRYDTPQR